MKVGLCEALALCRLARQRQPLRSQAVECTTEHNLSLTANEHCGSFGCCGWFGAAEEPVEHLLIETSRFAKQKTMQLATRADWAEHSVIAMQREG